MNRARSGRDMGGSEVWGRGGVVRWRWGCGGGGSSEGGGEGVGRSSHHNQYQQHGAVPRASTSGRPSVPGGVGGCERSP